MSYFYLKSETQEIIDKIGRIGSYFWERGWAGGNAGNISFHIKEFINDEVSPGCRPSHKEFVHEYPLLAGNYYLVTASGRRMRDIRNFQEENLCIVKISPGGKSYDIVWGCKIGRFPTSEFEAHLGAYNARKEIGKPISTVIHTQPLDMISLSLIPEYQSSERFSELIWKMQPETILNIPEGIAFLDYEIPGSIELADRSATAFKNGYRIAIWANHGVIAIGEELDEVLDLIDHANSSTIIALKLMKAGYNPRNLGLKNDDLIKLCKVFNLRNSPFYPGS